MGYTQNIKERKGHFSCYCFCKESISSKQLLEWSYSSPEGLDSKVGSKDFRHHMVLRVNLAGGGNCSSPTGYKEEGKP